MRKCKKKNQINQINKDKNKDKNKKKNPVNYDAYILKKKKRETSSNETVMRWVDIYSSLQTQTQRCNG